MFSFAAVVVAGCCQLKHNSNKNESLLLLPPSSLLLPPRSCPRTCSHSPNTAFWLTEPPPANTRLSLADLPSPGALHQSELILTHTGNTQQSLWIYFSSRQGLLFLLTETKTTIYNLLPTKSLSYTKPVPQDSRRFFTLISLQVSYIYNFCWGWRLNYVCGWFGWAATVMSFMWVFKDSG